MNGVSNGLIVPPRYRTQNLARPRSEAKRARIVEASMAHFAEHGFHAARVGDIAAELGIAKGSIFQHFKSKDGLFFGGGWSLLGEQILAVGVVLAFSFVVSMLIGMALRRTLRGGVRVTEDEEDTGLDLTLHSETGYALERV